MFFFVLKVLSLVFILFIFAKQTNKIFTVIKVNLRFWKLKGKLLIIVFDKSTKRSNYTASRRWQATSIFYPLLKPYLFQLSSAMASLLLASPSPLSVQLHNSTCHLSFSHSQTLSSPLSTSFPSLSASATTTLSPTPSGNFCNNKTIKKKNQTFY